MERIASFTVDHDRIEPGLYISRVDGDVTSYDLRTRKPNAGDYMDNTVMHSVEHLFATFIRNGAIGAQVLYFGPMGCQTGFYLLVCDTEPAQVRGAALSTLRQILEYDGPVFGASRKECGNWQNLSLQAAKTECARYLAVLQKQDNSFAYPSAAEGARI